LWHEEFLKLKANRAELIPLSFGFETEKREATNSSEEKKKELRRVYRKLKGVRSQISMKTKELKKEVKEADYTHEDETDVIPETDEYEKTDKSDDEWSSEEKEIGKRRGPTATQFELKMLVDHKAKLRKRFQKLQEEVRKR
jgi:hypothetical protein